MIKIDSFININLLDIYTNWLKKIEKRGSLMILEN